MEEEQVDDVVPPEQIKCRWHKRGVSEIKIVGGTVPKGVEQTQLTSLKGSLVCWEKPRDPVAEIVALIDSEVQQTMHTKVFACLLLSTLIGTSLSRSMSASHQGKAVREADELPRMNLQRIGRQEWPDQLTETQKGLVSQFLPHIYAGQKKVQGEDHWTDFGRRRSSED